MPDVDRLQQAIEQYPSEIQDRLLRIAEAAVFQEAKREFSENCEPIQTISAWELIMTEWPEPTWAVPGLLPAGLTIFAGKQKAGKSWLALQIAQAVAAGGHVLGQQIERGPVLYLALEDIPRRLQDRMKKQKWPADKSLEADFMVLGNFLDRVGDLRNGGNETLARQIERRGYRLVVIDTLSRAVMGTADQMDVDDMTTTLSPVQEVAFNNNCAVMLVDHHNKAASYTPDVINNILGSAAKAAVADTLWGIYREQGRAGAKLAIIGRDVEEKTLALSWDWLTGCWQVEGDAYEIELTERRLEILEAGHNLGKCGLMDIVAVVDQPKSHTHTRLQDLANEGFFLRTEEGRHVYYELTDKGWEAL